MSNFVRRFQDRRLRVGDRVAQTPAHYVFRIAGVKEPFCVSVNTENLRDEKALDVARLEKWASEGWTVVAPIMREHLPPGPSEADCLSFAQCLAVEAFG